MSLTANRMKVIHKPKIKNCQLTEASFANLALEGESGIFWFHQMQDFNVKSCKGNPQTKSQKPSAHRSQLC
jgi:hypothetical protein